MAKTPTALEESLNRAQASIARTLLTKALNGLPGSMSMGQLIDDFAGSQYNETFRGMTLNAFTEAVEGGASTKSSGNAGSNFNTRTLEGRAQIDAAIGAHLESVGTTSSEEARAALGGTAAQIRESMARLAEQGLVTITGEKRATRYSWKAKGGKKGK